MKSKFSRKLLPFSPGIPWTIKNNKYIVPQINGTIWNRVLADKDFIVTCYGGFMESFFSLSYCEALSSIFPDKKIKWMGREKFRPLVKLQGVASLSSFSLDEETISKYPAPIFMDAENNAYFNVLNNYLETKSYRLTDPVKNDEILLKQLYQNCMIPWDNYAPKFRNVNNKYKTWVKTNNFYDNRKYILIIHKSFGTMHEKDCLEWSSHYVRELSALVRHMGIRVVACGFEAGVGYYNAGGVISAPMDLEIVMGLMENAFCILSKDIDGIMASMAMPKSPIIMSRDVSDVYDIYSNAEYLGSSNVIFEDRNLLPKDVYQIIEGMHE